MIDKKNTFLFILLDFVQFCPRENFVRGAFEDCLVLDKICKWSRQTILICYAFVMKENLSKLIAFSLMKVGPNTFE